MRRGVPILAVMASASIMVASAGAPPALVGDGVADDTAAIQSLLDSGAGVVALPHPAKEYLVSRTLRIGSGQELRLGRETRIRLAPGSNCPMLANGDWSGGNSNITVSGGIWDGDNMRQWPNPWCIQHVGAPYATLKELPPGMAPPGADYQGFMMDFRRVDGFVLKGVTLRNPTTFGFCGSRLSNFSIDDVAFDYETFNPVRACLDGIHLDGGCHHGSITNLRGPCWDDTVALNADDEAHSASNGEPIHDILIDGIEAYGSHSAVRLLSAGAPIRNVTIRNVKGTFYRYAVGLTHYFAWEPHRPRGRFDGIRLENLRVAKCAQPPNCVREPLTPMPLVFIDEKLDVGTLEIDGFVRDESARPEDPAILVRAGSEVMRLDIRGATQTNRTDRSMEFLKIDGKVRELSTPTMPILK